MQSHMAILVAYCIGMKKDHQTLLNFAIFAGKRQKRNFSYKVASKKIFMVGPKGRPSHRAPLNTSLPALPRNITLHAGEKERIITTMYTLLHFR